MAHRSRVSTIVAWVYYRARRYGRAIDQCQRALELDPNFAVAHHLLGWIYDRESRFDEAISEARKSVELSGRSPLMTASLGYARRRLEYPLVVWSRMYPVFRRRDPISPATAGVRDQASSLASR